MPACSIEHSKSWRRGEAVCGAFPPSLVLPDLHVPCHRLFGGQSRVGLSHSRLCISNNKPPSQFPVSHACLLVRSFTLHCHCDYCHALPHRFVSAPLQTCHTIPAASPFLSLRWAFMSPRQPRIAHRPPLQPQPRINPLRKRPNDRIAAPQILHDP